MVPSMCLKVSTGSPASSASMSTDEGETRIPDAPTVSLSLYPCGVFVWLPHGDRVPEMRP